MPGAKVPEDKLTRRIAKLAVMEANECSRAEKLKEVFGVDMATATPREINNCDATMSRWRKHPAFDQAWKEEARRWDYEDYITARAVFRQGMKQTKDGWLAMNSAVNALNNASKRLFQDEERAIHVKVDGMPEIGSPDDD